MQNYQQTYTQTTLPLIYPDNLKQVIERARRLIKPSIRLTPAEWAARYVIIPEGSARAGSMFDPAEIRYVIEILNACADPNIDEITVMSSAQIFKTTMGLIFIAYLIDSDPAPILVLQPTIKAAETYSKTKFDRFVEKISSVKRKISENKSRYKSNTLGYKEFPGGFALFVGGNSPVDLAGHSVKIVISEDIDRIPPSAGLEGDPVELAEQRTESFKLYGYKHIRFSTPTVHGSSRIQKLYLSGDQSKFFFNCPHCGFRQSFEFFPKETNDGQKYGGVVWEKETDMFGKTLEHKCETAVYICANPETRCVITEHDKRKILSSPSLKSEPGNIKAKRHRSFMLNRMYSILSTFAQLAQEFVDANKDKDPESLKVFYNTSLGLPWKENVVEEIDELGLMRSTENYLTEENPYLPNDILFLTCAVDTHPDRFELSVEGWGLGEENWLVHYEQLWGDPDQLDVREQLDNFLMKTKWTRQDGTVLELGGYMLNRRHYATLIDAMGRNTQSVYEYCRTRQQYGIIAIQGKAGAGYPALLTRSKVGKNRDVLLQRLGVDTIKQIIWTRLHRSISNDGRKISGPKTSHFTTAFCDAHYFDGLLAERPFLIYDRSYGNVYIWKKLKKGMRNEPWDLKVYNYAAMKISNVNFELLKETLHNRKKETTAAPADTLTRPAGRVMKVTKVIR